MRYGAPAPGPANGPAYGPPGGPAPRPAPGPAPGPGFVANFRRPSDVEAGIPPSDFPDVNPFTDKYVRIGFIRKVYAILSVQLLITTAMIAACVFVPELNKFAKANGMAMIIVGSIGSVVVLFTLLCCGNLQRSFPTNFILLFLFTILESVSLSATCVFYKRDEVMMAAGITATVFILLTIFAMQTAIDFTVYTGIAFVLLILLVIFGLVAAFFPTGIIRMAYACAGAGIFSFYIVLDTQHIMGGENRACQLSPEDYIAGALALYMDVITLFIYILQILRQLNGDD